MKVRKSFNGPFSERPFYTDNEIEHICLSELRQAGLLPQQPEPVRIERFIEKRFNVTPKYDDLPNGLLGYTIFGKKGVEEIIISRELSEDDRPFSERRVNSTLAHEAGHGLFHTHLFLLEGSTESLFDMSSQTDRQRILCRDEDVRPESQRKVYDGRWWEYQANRAIGALLIPRPLVNVSLNDLFSKEGKLETLILPISVRDQAIKRMSEVFNVNSIVAKIRVSELFPIRNERQLAV
jgi:Zn-dependent peptidase ImmA (M78 family)